MVDCGEWSTPNNAPSATCHGENVRESWFLVVLCGSVRFLAGRSCLNCLAALGAAIFAGADVVATPCANLHRPTPSLGQIFRQSNRQGQDGAVDRRHAHQGRDLLTIELAQLRHKWGLDHVSIGAIGILIIMVLLLGLNYLLSGMMD